MNVVIKSLSRIVGDPNGARRLVSVGSGWKLLSWMNLLCPPKKLAPRRRIRAHNCFLSTVPPGSQLLKLLLCLGVVLLCGRYFSLLSEFNHEFGSNMSSIDSSFCFSTYDVLEVVFYLLYFMKTYYIVLIKVVYIAKFLCGWTNCNLYPYVLSPLMSFLTFSNYFLVNVLL